MSDIKTRKFKCTGCGEDRPCYLETNKESSIMDVYTEDILVCVLDATNRTGFNWEEVEANGVTTGEKQCNLPDVVFSEAEKCKHHPCQNGGHDYCDYPHCDQYEKGEAEVCQCAIPSTTMETAQRCIKCNKPIDWQT